MTSDSQKLTTGKLNSLVLHAVPIRRKPVSSEWVAPNLAGPIAWTAAYVIDINNIPRVFQTVPFSAISTILDLIFGSIPERIGSTGRPSADTLRARGE